MQKDFLHLGILGAMPEEVSSILRQLKNVRKNTFGDFECFTGEWINKSKLNNKVFISLGWSGWGKVSAARAAMRLITLDIDNYPKVESIIFCGVAGAASSLLNQWDILIPYELIQHDMDATPIYAEHIIPALNESRLKADFELVKWSTEIIKKAKKEAIINEFGKVYNELVATGDTFISDKEKIREIQIKIPELYAVEMEGAAVAQVANQENIPCLIIRIISDKADGSAQENFEDFLKIYQDSSWKLIEILISDCKNWPL